MDPVVLLGIAASTVTVLAFIYMLIFGQRGLVDVLERNRQAKSSRSTEDRTTDMSSSQHVTTTHQSADLSLSPGTAETLVPQVIAYMPNHYSSSFSRDSQETPIIDRTVQEVIQHFAPDVEAKLASGVLTAGDDIARALPYAALARKGINKELLCQLTGWSEARGNQALADLQRFPFVRTERSSARLFLNDEMYELLKQRIWNQLDSAKNDFCEIILDYYHKQMTLTKGTQRQTLLVERLYYQFLADPREGYAEYSRLSDGALYEQDVSFDMRLRDEMLRFYSENPESRTLTQEFIDYDAAVRWVKRHRFAREYDKAIRVAEKVKTDLAAGQASNVDFQLARADLDVNHAMALIYSGRIDPGIAMLRTVIADLEGKQKSDALAQKDMDDFFCTWRRNLVLGLAHNNLGYTYWTVSGRYRAALAEFHAALSYFLAANLEEEIANTSDNMGRVYAQLADRTRAELLVRDGLSLRHRLGREIRIGLSLNSQILLRSSFGDPYGAYRLSKQRLQTFMQLGAQREIGLVCITLGHSLRQLGTLRKMRIYGDEECDEFFREATQHLNKAIEIFSPHAIDEPIRLIEAYNELGCVYRERAICIDTGESKRSVTPMDDAAIKNLQQAITQAREKEYWVQFVDSYEDLAQVYFQTGQLDNAEECLDKAEEVVPDIYKIKAGAGLQEISLEDCSEEYWRQMAKIELLRGHIVFDHEQPNSDGVRRRSKLDQALEHYALAADYLERYSGQVRFQTAVEQLYDHFKRRNRTDLAYAQNELLPAIAAKYCLDLTRLNDFFKDTLGLALQIAQ